MRWRPVELVAMIAGFALYWPVGLAVLGMLVGIALGREMRAAPRLFAAASLESLVTIGAVAAATVYFVQRTGLPVGAPLLALALALGLCASASSATSADPDSEPAAAIGTRVADLDDVLPIALASCAMLPAVSGSDTWVLVFALTPEVTCAGCGAGVAALLVRCA